MQFILALIFIFNPFKPVFSAAVSPSCMCNRTSDSLALVDVYNNANGASWISPWNLSMPMTTWLGVSLDANQCVRALILDNRGLSGTLSSQIGMLSNLRTLSLLNNNLTGNIPSSIGDLSQLEDIILSDNNFTGEIPDFFASLPALKIISMSNNFFIGNIPKSIGSIFGLLTLDLSTNSMIGSIPSELGNNVNLKILNLSNNFFSGTMPVELADISTLQEVYLHMNNLSGIWHPFFAAWNNVKHVWIQNNAFEGTVPDWRAAPLISLKIEFNNFTNIPDYSSVTTWGISAPYGMNIIGNRFTFEDLIPLQHFPPRAFYTFKNQQPVQIDSIVFIPFGGNYTLRLNVDDTVAENTYKWIKDTSFIIVNKNSFNFLNTKYSDEGFYYGTISNPAIPNFELTIQRLRVVVTKPNCELPQAGISCSNATLFCGTERFDNYCGLLGLIDSTKLENVSFCNTTRKIENPKWFTFITSSDSLQLEVIIDECSTINIGTNSYTGLEAAIFESCETGLADHKYCAFTNRGQSLKIGGGGFVVGKQYYLVLDGNHGSICDFVIRVIKGKQSYNIADPKPIVGDTIICQQDSFSIEFSSRKVDEALHYYWYLNDSLINSAKDTFIQFRNLPIGTYTLKFNASNVCDTSIFSTKTFKVFSKFEMSTPFVTTYNRDSVFTLSFSLLGGKPPYKLLEGQGELDSLRGFFVSSELLCKSSYKFLFADANLCTVSLEGQQNCSCNSIPGVYSSDTVFQCEGQILNAQLPAQAYLDSFDISTFILSSVDTTPLTTILKINKNGNFAFDPQLFRFNTVYYLRYLVGKPNARNEVNINHPCFGMSNSKKIVFKSRPIVSAGADQTTCLLDANLRGFGNYNSGLWRMINGPGIAVFDNADLDETMVHVDTGGIYTFVREGYNDYCSHRDEVIINFKDTLRPAIIGVANLCGKGRSSISIDKSLYKNYKWSTGDSSFSIQVLNKGIYCVSVTDFDDCMGYSCIDVLDSIPMNPVILGIDKICASTFDSLIVQQNFTSYQWNDSTFTNKIIINKAGNYCVTVTDQNGCTTTTCKNVIGIPEAKSSIIDTGCIDEVRIVNGLEFNYPGNYKITLPNASYLGCDSIIQLDLAVNTPLIVIDSLIKSDNGTNNGSISVTIAGGKKPYRYLWNNNATSPSIFNLKFGEYKLKVTDANDCEFEFVFNIRMSTANYDPESSNTGLLFYPNPLTNKGSLLVRNNSIESFWIIRVIDLNGKSHAQFNLNFDQKGETKKVNLNLEKGAYFVEYFNEHQRPKIEKLIIN